MRKAVLIMVIFCLFCGRCSKPSKTTEEKTFPEWNNMNYEIKVRDLPFIIVIGTGGKHFRKYMEWGEGGFNSLIGVTTLKQLRAFFMLSRYSQDELEALLKKHGYENNNLSGLALVTKVLRALYPPKIGDRMVYWLGAPTEEIFGHRKLPIKFATEVGILAAAIFETDKKGIRKQRVSEDEEKKILIEQFRNVVKDKDRPIRSHGSPFTLVPLLNKDKIGKIKKAKIRFNDCWFRVIYYKLEQSSVYCIALPGIIVFDMPVITFRLEAALWAVYFPAKDFFWENTNPDNWEWIVE